MMAADALLRDPEWFAHRFVESDDAFRFVRLPRARHAKMAFLTDDYFGEAESGGDVPAAECVALPGDPPLHYLFHSAFCGSTMLVRALAEPGVAMGLSEPLLFNDVVGFRQRGAQPREVARIADLGTRLLGRPFGPGEAVIAKPSNIVNPLAALMMMVRPQARALFLFAPLETFLVSVANKGLHCRIWARQLIRSYLTDGALQDMGLDADDLFLHSDLQSAAVGWLAQLRLFSQLSERVGAERLASLDSDTMLARPAQALAAVAGHYGLALDDAACAKIAAGPAFTRHSKSGEAYSPERRDADYQRVRAAHGAEIAMVAEWTRAVADSAGIAMTAPNPLPVQA